MAVRPRVYGRVYIEKQGASLYARLSLEVYGDIFYTEFGVVDARDKPATVEYRVRLEPGRYYNPVETPLPRLQPPYRLVEAAIVYEHDPRVNIVQGGPEYTSTIVLTATAYTMVEGPTYPHILVEHDGAERVLGDEALLAYPLSPRDERLAIYTEYEYTMLKRGVDCPWFNAALLTCRPGDCVLEKLWRRKRATARLSAVASCWSKLVYSRLIPPEPIAVEVEEGNVRAKGRGVVRLEVSCVRGEGFVLEGLVEGVREWRLGEGCGIIRYSSLCPLCSLPP